MVWFPGLGLRALAAVPLVSPAPSPPPAPLPGLPAVPPTVLPTVLPSVLPTLSPSPSGPPTLFRETVVNPNALPADVLRACGQAPTTDCIHVYNVTHSAFLASLAEPVLTAFHVAVIVVGAVVLRLFFGRLIRRLVSTTASGRVTRGLSRLDRPGGLLELDPQSVERRAARASTLGSVLRSISNATILTLAVVLVLGEIGLNLAPILASAGILGVAVGFGAQSVVKDFLSGLFLVLEDQYGVGDVITVDVVTPPVTGVVESIGLRSTRVRDVRGTLWHLRNGEITAVGNVSQGWSRVVLDVLLEHGTDVAEARQVLLDAASAVRDEREPGDVLEDPAVWGVEDVTLDGIVLRLAVKVRAPVKDDVARALRERLVRAFPAHGVRVATGTRQLVVAPPGRDRLGAGAAGQGEAHGRD